MKLHDYPWQLLLVLALGGFVPTACVIWFMGEAMNNERLAVNQKVAALYQQRFEQVQERLHEHWRQKFDALEALESSQNKAQLFANVVRQDLASSVLIRDQRGDILYPSRNMESDQQMPYDWDRAQAIEYRTMDFLAAAKAYQGVAESAKSSDVAARAYMALARTFIRSQRYAEALELLAVTLAETRFDKAQDALGQLIQPNAQLRALQLIRSLEKDELTRLENSAAVLPSLASFRQQALNTLIVRLNNYEDHDLKASQRRFLMGQLVDYVGDQTSSAHTMISIQHALSIQWTLPIYQAERLAARYMASGSAGVNSGGLRDTPLPGVLHYISENNRLVALYTQQAIISEFERLKVDWQIPEGVDVKLFPPATISASTVTPVLTSEETKDEAITILSAGAPLYGWYLSFSFTDKSPFSSAASKQISVYLWVGILIVFTLIVLAVVTARFVGHQLRNSRLKRDLVDTVSHELKTPLASIRLLVDTLLNESHQPSNAQGTSHTQGNSHQPSNHQQNSSQGNRRALDETTREYLQLIARENLRLSQLVDNLLTFSRLEKQSHRFDFQYQHPEAIAQLALDAVREKSLAQGFSIEVSISEDLPEIVADENLLVTALVNLLDNALKYSGDSRKIQFRLEQSTRPEGSGKRALCKERSGKAGKTAMVCFQIQDFGIGIPDKDLNKIFGRFYRVDKQLSQEVEGCGLGLNIVDFVVKSHSGCVVVDSEQGQGSLFSLYLPLVDSAAAEQLLKDV